MAIEDSIMNEQDFRWGFGNTAKNTMRLILQTPIAELCSMKNKKQSAINIKLK